MGKHYKNQLSSQSFLVADEVKAICEPFFNETGLNAFSYSRIYLDGSRAELWSDVDDLFHSFIKNKYISNIYNHALNNKKYVYLNEEVQYFHKNLQSLYLQHMTDQKNIFNHDNCFLIIKKKNKLIENFMFYTPINFQYPINFYLNNLDELEYFASQFKKKSVQHY